jgi:hypothetical protein
MKEYTEKDLEANMRNLVKRQLEAEINRFKQDASLSGASKPMGKSGRKAWS